MDLNALTGTSIALVLLYLQLALAVSAFTELVSALWDFRARDLDRWLELALGKGGLGTAVRAHPLLAGAEGRRWLISKQVRRPTWIEPEAFARAVLAAVREHQAALATSPPKAHEELAKELASPEVLRQLNHLLAGDAEANLAAWFSAGMRGVGDEYRRWARMLNLAVAFALAALVNADTVRLVVEMPRQQAVQASVGRAAAQIVATGLQQSMLATDATAPQRAEAAATRLQAALQEAGKQPLLGWFTADGEVDWAQVASVKDVAFKLAGLVITALATSLGAPFWFDLLKRFVGARGTVEGAAK
jgi:hypothetical protein